MPRTYLSAIPSPHGRPPGGGEFVVSSQYGTVRVYTRRHINGCALVGSNANYCSCPKWIYSKGRGGDHAQQSAKTPSFAEARVLALKILRSFEKPEARPTQPPPVPGEPTVPATGRARLLRARITLAACRKIEGLTRHAMKDQLYPEAKLRNRYDSVKKLFKNHGEEIDLLAAALSEAGRRVIAAAESIQTITQLAPPAASGNPQIE